MEPRVLRSVESPLAYMPSQGLNLNEYESECDITAPHARNSAFRGHKSIKPLYFSQISLSLLPPPPWTRQWLAHTVHTVYIPNKVCQSFPRHDKCRRFFSSDRQPAHHSDQKC